MWVTNIYDVAIAVFGHFWGSFHYIMSYFKSSVPHQDESIVYCVSPNNNMNLPKKDCFLLMPFQRRIGNPVKDLIWNVLQKHLTVFVVNYFCEMLHLRCLAGFSTWPCISSYYTTQISNWIGSIYKHVSPFILVSRGKMTETRKGNRFSWPTWWFTFDLPSKLFVPGSF